MRRLLIALVLVLAGGCVGHIFALPFFVVAEADEAVCKAKLPKGTRDPNGHGLIYVCREPQGADAGHWELIGTDCSDIPQPVFEPDAGVLSQRCELVDGGSAWVPIAWAIPPPIPPPPPAPCSDTGPPAHEINLAGCQTLCGVRRAVLHESPCGNSCTCTPRDCETGECGGSSQLTDEPTPK